MERAAQVLCGGCGERARLFGVAAAPQTAENPWAPRGQRRPLCPGACRGPALAPGTAANRPPWANAAAGPRPWAGAATSAGNAKLPSKRIRSWAEVLSGVDGDVDSDPQTQSAALMGAAPSWNAGSAPRLSYFVQKTPEDALAEALELATPQELSRFLDDPLQWPDDPPVHPRCAPTPFLLADSTACTICTGPAPWAYKPCRGECGTLGRRLLLAAQQGRLREVWGLLLRGADVNSSAAGRWTPLHRAAAKGHAPVLWLLLHKGALVDAPTVYGVTALHAAASGDRTARCVAMLLAAGAHVNSRDRLGRTPLHAASQSGNCAAARTLLRAGACAEAATNNGDTPADLAATPGVRKMLLS